MVEYIVTYRLLEYEDIALVKTYHTVKCKRTSPILKSLTICI